MPQRIGSTGKTKLAKLRLKREITQHDLAEKAGIHFRTYRRLEAGEIWNPSIRELANLAIALGVELEELIEPEWRRWSRFNEKVAKPPHRDDLWGTAGIPHRRRQRVLSGEERREREAKQAAWEAEQKAERRKRPRPFWER